jgi:aspartyl-tRNA(Asn)/glutamyl-tRNA(Gln) amidotransferase subunit B
MSDKYVTYVGLEIHIHLLTETKMFCSCKNHFGDEPNTNVCPVCMGWPGVLPKTNEKAMEHGYRIAQALNCTMSEHALFARKNYFYPDMPKNYQISQFSDPVGVNGYVDIPLPSGGIKRVRIHECHVEEDAGKLIHAGDITLIDLNRAGVPLMEIVSEPDLSSGEEAEAYIQYFQRLVRYLGVSDGNMEEGSLRCDANISINLPGKGLGSKVEVKNLNSSRFVRLSLDYEAERQAKVIDEGGEIRQETRLWNENRDCTAVMRTKESAHDYRFFPEPDLPPFIPTPDFLKRIKDAAVELPLVRKNRLISDFGLSGEQAETIHESRALCDYFEDAAKKARSLAPKALGDLAEAGKAVALLLIGDVKKEENRAGVEITKSPMTSTRLASIAALLANGKIHSKIAKQLIADVFAENLDPEEIMNKKGLEQVTDPAALKPIIAKVFSEHAKVVEGVKAGDAKQKEFLIGKVMQETRGKAAPALVRELVEKELSV